jgi:hypothetical protein
MSFFDDASLVMIPSGYKDQKVYSVKPTDGTGDLTFSRASSATRVQSNGLIEKVRENLILQSQDFTTSWSAASATVTANTTANPLNGAINADTITLTGATTQKFINQAFVFSGTYTTSVYLKAGTHQFVQLMLGTDPTPFANFDLVNGTASAGGSTATIVAAGGGWYRCSMSFTSVLGTTVFITAADSLATPRFQPTASTGTYIAFGYQLETGDIATDYIATTTAAVSVGPVSGLPRLDYLGSTCPRLLLEPQRTNNVTYSEQLDNAAWTFATAGSASAPVVTANYGISPSGYQDAERVQFSRTGTTASDYSLIDRSTISTAAGVVSFYGKSLSGTQSILLYYGSVGQVFTLTTEWQRFSLYAPTTTTDLSIGTRGGTGSYFNGGSLTIDCLLWGFQKEAGAYATSYIPTLGASVTRVADAASKTGISSLIGQTEGVVFVEFNNRLLASYPNEYIVQIISGTTQLWLRKEVGGGSFTARLIVSGTTIWTFASLIVPINGNNKIAIAYKTGDSAVFLNGAQVSSTNTSAFSGSAFADLNFNFGGTLNPELPLSQALIFKTRLTNAQLAELTA